MAVSPSGNSRNKGSFEGLKKRHRQSGANGDKRTFFVAFQHKEDITFGWFIIIFDRELCSKVLKDALLLFLLLAWNEVQETLQT